MTKPITASFGSSLYGLYSSRIKDAWKSMPHVVERAPAGWKSQHQSLELPKLPGSSA